MNIWFFCKTQKKALPKSLIFETSENLTVLASEFYHQKYFNKFLLGWEWEIQRKIIIKNKVVKILPKNRINLLFHLIYPWKLLFNFKKKKKSINFVKLKLIIINIKFHC